jgi:hypothetical protein
MADDPDEHCRTDAAHASAADSYGRPTVG